MADSIAHLGLVVSMDRGQTSSRGMADRAGFEPASGFSRYFFSKEAQSTRLCHLSCAGQRETVYHGLAGSSSMRTGQNDHCARTRCGRGGDILSAASTYWKVVRIGKEPVPKTGVALRLGRSNRPPSANYVRCAGIAFSDCRSTVEHLTFNQGIAGSTPVSPTIQES